MAVDIEYICSECGHKENLPELIGDSWVCSHIPQSMMNEWARHLDCTVEELKDWTVRELKDFLPFHWEDNYFQLERKLVCHGIMKPLNLLIRLNHILTMASNNECPKCNAYIEFEDNKCNECNAINPLRLIGI